ncbi:MAG: 50S ribosomal protein L6 [Deltaproteobacteria bacterium]|nr:50S ribosomal protein L6 [Deltaproteobacteria bacterium]
MSSEGQSEFVVSRVGKAPVALPPKVTVAVAGDVVTVKGPLGTLVRTFKGVTFEQQAGQILVHPVENTRTGKALHGLGRNLLRNMVQGVTAGYKKELDVQGVGFKVEQIGQALKLSVGYSHPVHFVLPKGVECKIDKLTHIELTSTDKELLGQTAATLRSIRSPEPYKGKGIRYSGEKVRQKAGKSGGKGAKKK